MNTKSQPARLPESNGYGRGGGVWWLATVKTWEVPGSHFSSLNALLYTLGLKKYLWSRLHVMKKLGSVGRKKVFSLFFHGFGSLE